MNGDTSERAMSITLPTSERGKEAAFLKLVQRAQKGDQAALAQVRQRFDALPMVALSLGHLARHAQDAWVGLASGNNVVVKEAVERKLAALRAELAGPAPSPLEQLLVERILACWVQVQYADHSATAFERKGGRFAEGEYWQRMQERAHRRYLVAIRTLAQVRRLLVPAVQVNIAEQQVNVLR